MEARLLAITALPWFVRLRPVLRNVAPVARLPHHENIFDLPPELGAPLQRAAQDAAIAMKTAFACHGVSTQQHNEPAGDQDVWHYHLHVFPRWEGDGLYRAAGAMAPRSEVRRRADQLREAWPTT